MTIKGNLCDLFAVPLLVYFGFTSSAWFFVPTIVIAISWFGRFGWSSKIGWFAEWHE